MVRQCGTCSKCCTLVPVRELDKGAGQRCKHQRAFKGCAVYRQPKKGFPVSCYLWNCRWLTGDDTAELSRPDRSHVVIDLFPDFVTMQPHDGSPGQHIEVVQVWCDPKHPEAVKTPEFMAYMERRAAENKACIVRFDNVNAIVVFPPALSSDRQWHFVDSNLSHQESHTLEDVMAALGGVPMLTLSEA